MINNLESYNKAQLIELVKTQIEEYQKLDKDHASLKKFINFQGEVVANSEIEIAELEQELFVTRTQSECDLEYLCKSYAEYSHLCAVMRVMPNYQDWLIEQGLSTELAPNVGQWISVDEAEPEEGHLYWHTHIRPDGSFTEVLVGAYVKAFKKMDSGNFTHYMKCVKPLPPKEQGQ